jgi:hypothetical protein
MCRRTERQTSSKKDRFFGKVILLLIVVHLKEKDGFFPLFAAIICLAVVLLVLDLCVDLNSLRW